MPITAKVTCNLKQNYNVTGSDYATVGFMPDYSDDRNKEWSDATPHLDLRMTLRGAVADQFAPGKSYTLTFTEELIEGSGTELA